MGFFKSGFQLTSGPHLAYAFFSMAILSGCQEQEYYQKEHFEGIAVPKFNNSSDSDVSQNQGGNTGNNGNSGSNNSNNGNSGNNNSGGSTGSNGGSTGSNGGSTGSNGGSTGSNGGSTGSNGGSTGSNGGSSNNGVCGTGRLAPQVDTFYQNSQAQSTKLDLLWVMDNSGSMSDEQANIAQNFATFIQRFLTKNIDFTMGITTTDMSNNPGRMVGNFSSLNAQAAANNATQFMNYFRQQIQVGINGSGQEKGLAAADAFLTRYGSTFVRNDALLVTIFVSDEEDQSALSVADYQQIFTGYKGQAGYFKAYSVVNTQVGNFNRGARYQEMSSLTGGSSAEITGNFYNILDQISNQIVLLLESFPLTQNPYDNQVQVAIDGQARSQGWTYDLSTRSLNFPTGQEPAAGAEISVTYQYCDMN